MSFGDTLLSVLQNLNRLLVTNNVIKGDYLLYQDGTGYYSPSKMSSLYRYISYGILYDTNTRFDCFLEISRQIENRLKGFMMTDYYERDIRDNQEVIKICLDAVNTFDGIIDSAKNRDFIWEKMEGSRNENRGTVA